MCVLLRGPRNDDGQAYRPFVAQLCPCPLLLSPVWAVPTYYARLAAATQRPKRVSPGGLFGFWGRSCESLPESASDQCTVNTRVRRPVVASVTVQRRRGRASWWFRLFHKLRSGRPARLSSLFTCILALITLMPCAKTTFLSRVSREVGCEAGRGRGGQSGRCV